MKENIMTIPKRSNELIEEEILHKLDHLEHGLEQLVGDGESLEDVLRHDKGHDDWHAMNGDAPCTSEADCAAKRSHYKDSKCNCNSSSCPQCGRQVLSFNSRNTQLAPSSWVEQNSNLDSDW